HDHHRPPRALDRRLARLCLPHDHQAAQGAQAQRGRFGDYDHHAREFFHQCAGFGGAAMLKGTTYRGKAVIYACYDRRADSYSLIGTDDECLAELKAREFLSLPNRNNLEVRNGRYWRPGKTDKRRADRKSGITWGIDPAADDSYLSVFAPAIALTSTQPAANPSL